MKRKVAKEYEYRKETDFASLSVLRIFALRK